MNRRQAYIGFGRWLGPLALLGLRLSTVATRQPRVRVLVRSEHGEILLVRGIISHLGHWTLPGGGVNRHEAFATAASREVHEETGIKKPADIFLYLRTVEKPELGLHFVAPLFVVSVKKSELPKTLHNPREIAELGWFDPLSLPPETDPIVFAALTEYGAMGNRKNDD